MKKLFFWVFFIFLSFSASPVFAKVGVGVGIGKIQIDEKLRPGVIYELPAFTVINTGDQGATYQVTIEYHENQPELWPDRNWFIFSPEEFYLEPGEIKQVNVKLNLPLKMEPGDYFAYLEAHPTTKVQQGETRVGVAAAAKLYFSVESANIFYGIYYKVISFFKVYAPWPQRGLFVLIAVVFMVLVKRFFNIEVGLKRSRRKVSDESDKDG